jgi:hypothetical protein
MEEEAGPVWRVTEMGLWVLAFLDFGELGPQGLAGVIMAEGAGQRP